MSDKTNPSTTIISLDPFTVVIIRGDTPQAMLSYNGFRKSPENLVLDIPNLVRDFLTHRSKSQTYEITPAETRCVVELCLDILKKDMLRVIRCKFGGDAPAKLHTDLDDWFEYVRTQRNVSKNPRRFSSIIDYSPIATDKLVVVYPWPPTEEKLHFLVRVQGKLPDELYVDEGLRIVTADNAWISCLVLENLCNFLVREDKPVELSQATNLVLSRACKSLHVSYEKLLYEPQQQNQGHVTAKSASPSVSAAKVPVFPSSTIEGDPGALEALMSVFRKPKQESKAAESSGKETKPFAPASEQPQTKLYYSGYDHSVKCFYRMVFEDFSMVVVNIDDAAGGPRVHLYSDLHDAAENKNPREPETLFTTTRILFMMGKINSKRLWLVVDKELKTICVRQTFAEAYLDLREITDNNT